jgi:hypothetical protein
MASDELTLHTDADGHRSRSDAIDAGREHEAAGRLLDAIDAYHEALLAGQDHDLARHTIHLRHSAALAMPATRPAPPRPRPVDPFPAIDGVPEISPDSIDVDVLGGTILHHGALIIRGLVDPSTAGELQSMAATAIHDRDAAASPGIAEAASSYREFEPHLPRTAKERPWVRATGGMLAADAPTVLCQVLELLGETPLLTAMTEHLGERPALAFNKCVLRKVRESHPTWHQDGAFMGGEVRTVDLWLSLSDCGKGTSASGLDIVPRRFDDLLPTQTHGAVFPSSIGEALLDEVAPGTRWIAPRFAPGDAVLFDERLVHRTGVSPEYTDLRYAVEAWFFAPSTMPDGYLPILA